MRQFVKKHYIAIAEVIAKSENIEELKDRIAILFQNDSSQFDSSRFYSYIKAKREELTKKTIGRTFKQCLAQIDRCNQEKKTLGRLDQTKETNSESIPPFQQYWKDKTGVKRDLDQSKKSTDRPVNNCETFNPRDWII